MPGLFESPLEVLYEDNHLLAVNKPAGLLTMGAGDDRPTLLAAAKQYIRQKYQKPGNVYLGIVSRLDGPVTGVVLLARTSKAAARLTEQFRNHSVAKTYWALVEKHVLGDGACVDWLKHDDRHHRVLIVTPESPGGKLSRLTYRVLRTVGTATLLEVALETGRKHQIRLQLAHRGYPIVGDRKYGSRREFPGRDGIALHARRLVVQHPVRDEPIELVAPLPQGWAQLGLRPPLPDE